jgi:transposase InsO family protein
VALPGHRHGPGLAPHRRLGHRRLADQHGVRLSVGRRGQCWDNAVAESFSSTIKTELLDRRPWPTRAAAHQAIFNWIEGWYNTRRRHSTLG